MVVGKRDFKQHYFVILRKFWNCGADVFETRFVSIFLGIVEFFGVFFLGVLCEVFSSGFCSSWPIIEFSGPISFCTGFISSFEWHIFEIYQLFCHLSIHMVIYSFKNSRLRTCLCPEYTLSSNCAPESESNWAVSGGHCSASIEPDSSRRGW